METTIIREYYLVETEDADREGWATHKTHHRTLQNARHTLAEFQRLGLTAVLTSVRIIRVIEIIEESREIVQEGY